MSQIKKLLPERDRTGLEKSMMDHLIDVRNFLIVAFIIWSIGSFISFFYINQIQGFLLGPVKNIGQKLNFLSPADGFLFIFKVTALAGFVLSLPFHLFLIWKYASGALLEKEKKLVGYFIFGSGFLTVFAIAYSWIWIIPISLKFLTDIKPEGTEILLTADEYFGFIFSMTAVMVAIFQVPTAVICLVKTGLVRVDTIKSKRKEIYIAIIILTALFGSPDLLTWVLTSIPAIFLFEISLIISTLGNKGEKNLTIN